MPKAESILQHLPDLYRTEDPAALVHGVVRAFAAKLDEIEDALLEVLKAHWIDHADELADLSYLGALFDIRRREGEGLEAYRQRLKRTIAAYLAGVGTVQVVRDITATTLGIPQDSEKYDLIEIIENPPRTVTGRLGGTARHPSTWQEVGYLSEWSVTVEGFEERDEEGRPKEIKPTISIMGVGDRTVNPMLMSVTTETLVGFRGFVPDGKVLVIYPDGRGVLDGADVTSQVYARGVSLFDRAIFDQDHFSTHALGTPTLPRGTSTWRYLAEFARFVPPESEFSSFDRAMFAIPPAWQGVDFDQARFDQSLFATLIQPKAGIWDWSRFDEAMFARPAARVRLEWVERQPATFVVQMPWTIVEPPDDGLDPRHLVKEEVNRVRAAGVLAIVRYLFGPDRLQEHQRQTSRLRQRSEVVHREHQEGTTKHRFTSRKSFSEHQVAVDGPPTAGGIFDETYFDHSAFTEGGRFQYEDGQRQHEDLRLSSSKRLSAEQRATESLTFEGNFGTTRFDSSRFGT